MPTKMIAPAHASSIGHGGEEYLVKNGIVSVPDHAATELAAHGFKKFVEPEEDSELVTDEDVEGAINVHEMTKKEMIAFLKKRNVKFPKPISVGELREIVEQELKDNPARGDELSAEGEE
jgi:hypothetical protein